MHSLLNLRLRDKSVFSVDNSVTGYLAGAHLGYWNSLDLQHNTTQAPPLGVEPLSYGAQPQQSLNPEENNTNGPQLFKVDK